MKRNFKLLAAVVVLAALVMTLASCELINDIIDKFNPDKPCEHQYTNTVTKEATCTEAGEMTLTCSNCGDTKTETIAPGHIEVDLPAKAPTCTEAGLSAGKKCSACDTVLTEQVTLNATGHKYADGVCSACGEVDVNYGKTFLDVTTTDNNCWVDKVTFTATGEGAYTFYLPVNLGAWDAEGCDNYTNAPYVDPYDPMGYDPEEEHKFTVELNAGETYEFYISSTDKKDWKIEYTYEACDVEDGDSAGGDGPTDIVLDGVYTGHSVYNSNITVTFNSMLGLVTFAQDGTSVACLFEVKDGEVVLYKNDGSGEEWNSMFYAITLENGVPVAATYNGNGYSLMAGAGDGGDDTDPDIDGTYTGTDAYDNAPLTVTVDSDAGTVEFVYNHPMWGPSTLTVDFAIVDGEVVLYAEDGSVLNPLAASLTLTDGELTEASYNGNSYTLAPSTGTGDGGEGGEGGNTDEIETTVDVYVDEENVITVTDADIEAGKIYAYLYVYESGEHALYSGDLFVSKVMTQDGKVVEKNDNDYYELDAWTGYIVEISTEYVFGPDDYTLNVEYQYPDGHQNNPEWLYVLESPVEFTANATYSLYWYTFYAPVTGKVTITSDSETALLLLTAVFGYEMEGTGSVTMEVMKGRQYYFGIVDFDVAEAYEVELSLTYTASAITTDGSKNFPHAVVIGNNTASVEEYGYEYFAFTATEAGTLTLSTTATNYAWASHTDINMFDGGESKDLVIHVEMDEIVYIAVETPDGAAASIAFTASFKADPKVSWFEDDVITDGSVANVVTIGENSYVSLSIYDRGQFTISWDNADAIVEQVFWMEGNTTLANGDTVESFFGVDLKIYLPDYAAGTVNLTITPVAAPAE